MKNELQVNGLKCAINIIDKKMIPVSTFIDNQDKLFPKEFNEMIKKKGFIDTMSSDEISIKLTSDIIAMVSDISNMTVINITSIMKHNNIPIVNENELYTDLLIIIIDSYLFNNPQGMIDLVNAKNYNSYHKYIYTYVPALLSDIYVRLQRENGLSNMYCMQMYANNTSLVIDQIISQINILLIYYLNEILAYLSKRLGLTPIPY